VAIAAVTAVVVTHHSPAQQKSSARTPVTTLRVAAPAATSIATLSGPTAGYDTPGGDQTLTLPPIWWGGASSLPVLGSRGGWLLVGVAQAPNGQSAWINATAATLAQTKYYVVIHTASERLDLYYAGQLRLAAPVDVGSAAHPTPQGVFSVAFFSAAPNSTYGPFVIVTTAHITGVSDWSQGGDGLVTIRGPLADDAAIGTTGAANTLGGIGMHVSDLANLRNVPAGTPISITD
jgi:L,D-transpeptidase catalytic domain